MKYAKKVGTVAQLDQTVSCYFMFKVNMVFCFTRTRPIPYIHSYYLLQCRGFTALISVLHLNKCVSHLQWLIHPIFPFSVMTFRLPCSHYAYHSQIAPGSSLCRVTTPGQTRRIDIRKILQIYLYLSSVEQWHEGQEHSDRSQTRHSIRPWKKTDKSSPIE